MKYIYRTILLPFIICIVLIAHIRSLIIFIKNYMIYGGELISYPEPQTKIIDVYNKVKDQVKSPDNLDVIIEKVSEMHPYKQLGDRDSYREYNEGWGDACDVLGENIKSAFKQETWQK